jgi:hypothetical protein
LRNCITLDLDHLSVLAIINELRLLPLNLVS